MPDIILTPDADPASRVSECKTSRVRGFRSMLLFFDDFISLAENLGDTPAIEIAGIAFGRAYPRSLVWSEEVDFVSRRDKFYLSVCDPRKSLGEGMLVAQRDFSEGALIEHDTSPTESLQGVRREARDVLVPHDFSELYDSKYWTAEISFFEALVSPAPTVPYDDILRFRENRAAEYLAFWDALYELAKAANDLRSLPKNEQLKRRIDGAVGEYKAVAQEAWSTRVLNNLSVRWVLDSGSQKGLIAAAAAAGAGFIDFGTSIALALGGALRIDCNLRPARPPLSQSAQAMSYLIDAREVPM